MRITEVRRAVAWPKGMDRKEDSVRHRNMRKVAGACAALAIVGYSAAFKASDEDKEYKVRLLRSLGGTSSRGNGINDRGVVTGFSNLPSGDRRAAIWQERGPIPIAPLGGRHSAIAWSGMNNSGLVVGLTQTDEPQSRPDWSCGAFLPSNEYACVGFVWEQRQMTALPTLGGQNGFAASANNRRQVVGWTETTTLDPSCTERPKPQFLAVLWDLNTGQTIELPPYQGGDRPNSTSAATDISDEGHVVGISGDCDQAVGRASARNAVMWKDGMVTDLGDLGADTWNTPTAITPTGDIVVGFANTPQGITHAWLWTERDDFACPKRPNTNICDLGTLEDGGSAQAWGVNERGQVVGTACRPDGYCRGFLWENGKMKDLEKLVGNFKFQLLNAMDINSRGEITGRAVVAPNVFEVFVATPRD